MLTLASILVATAAFMGLVVHMTPAWSRSDMFFAVTVDPAFRRTDEARAALRGYRLRAWVHTGLGIALVLAGLRFGLLPLAVAGELWIPLAGFFAFARAHRLVLPYAATPSGVREAALGPRRSPAWATTAAAGPLFLLGLTAFYLALRWQDIPARFPVHWDMEGRANGWSTRSASGVFGPIAVGVLVCAGNLALVRLLGSSARRPFVGGAPAEREAHARRTTTLVSTGVAYFVAVVFSWAGLLPFVGHENGPGVSPAVVAGLVLALLAAVLFASSRGPRSAAVAPGASPPGDRTPDAAWKWGLFYANPDDPALLVEKRAGIGYTVNLAHGKAWALLGLLVLAPLAGVLLLIAAT
jgi:hypothetical protein